MKKKVFFIYFFLSLIISFTFLTKSIYSVVIIPFKTYIPEEEEPKDNFSPLDLINYLSKNIIYSEISIGTPPQSIKMIYESGTHGTRIFQHMCSIPNSLYFPEKSSTYNITGFFSYSYLQMKNCLEICETIYLFSDIALSNKIPFYNINFIYSSNNISEQIDENNKTLPSYKYLENTCINSGLQIKYSNGYEYKLNLISQLKENKNYKLETYDLSIKYTSEKEGYIAIGAEPHIYDKDNYYELQYRLIGGVNRDNQKDWCLEFDEVYIQGKRLNDSKIYKKNINTYKTIKIEVDQGIVLGNKEYERIIYDEFFKELIDEEKCFLFSENKYHVYYCDKNLGFTYIKNNFPSLYFHMRQFSKIFEFTYKDLFVEKNNKIYFLVYFSDNSFLNYFSFGRVLLKKYFLTFNYENKMIGYYNQDLPGGKKKEKNENDSNEYKISFETYLLIGILIVTFGVIGFVLGKKVYDNARKKRIYEVEDNFDYLSKEEIN